MVTIMGAVTSASVGGLDIGLKMLDKKQGKTEPFKRYSDYGRIAMVGGGLAMDYLAPRMMSGMGAVMFYSALPKLEESVAELAKPDIFTLHARAPTAAASRGLRLQALNTGRTPSAPTDAGSKRGQL
jgi:hypothetical protein